MTTADELAPGMQRWHSTEEDGGPDVGIEIGMPDGSMLWIGEISTALWEADGCGVVAPDAGCWLVHYPNGGNGRVIGPVLQTWQDYGGVDLLASALRLASTAKLTARAFEESAELVETYDGPVLADAIHKLIGEPMSSECFDAGVKAGSVRTLLFACQNDIDAGRNVNLRSQTLDALKDLREAVDEAERALGL